MHWASPAGAASAGADCRARRVRCGGHRGRRARDRDRVSASAGICCGSSVPTGVCGFTSHTHRVIPAKAESRFAQRPRLEENCKGGKAEMVEGAGFEPAYAKRADLQSAGFNHSPTPPRGATDWRSKRRRAGRARRGRGYGWMNLGCQHPIAEKPDQRGRKAEMRVIGAAKRAAGEPEPMPDAPDDMLARPNAGRPSGAADMPPKGEEG